MVWEMNNKVVYEVTKDPVCKMIKMCKLNSCNGSDAQPAVEIIASYKTEQYVGDKSQLFSRNWDLLF